MVRPPGLEPGTNGLWVRCSNHWATGARYHIETLSILVQCWHKEPFATARSPTRLLALIARSSRQKCFYMVLGTGIEPVLVGWKPTVLTDRRTQYIRLYKFLRNILLSHYQLNNINYIRIRELVNNFFVCCQKTTLTLFTTRWFLNSCMYCNTTTALVNNFFNSLSKNNIWNSGWDLNSRFYGFAIRCIGPALPPLH